jgi:3-hydroxyacyl-CoA dehydrogenase
VAAFEIIASGKPVSAKQALQAGLVDRVTDEDLLPSALAWTRELLAAGSGPRRTSALPLPKEDLPAGFFDQFRAVVVMRQRGLPAPLAIVDCVEAATRLDFAEGAKFEREKFQQLVSSPESAALRHVFFAEREAARVDGLPADVTPRPVRSVGIVGAGTMGGGIAMSFANAGIPVTILEISREALERGLAVCRNNYERSASRGRFTAQQVEECMGRISGTTSYADLAGVDLVIEAVFENPGIKQDVFRQLDRVCKPGTIFASNTSYQNIDDIAAATSRAQDVLGMHFFSPANVMKLLEVVRGKNTAGDVITTVMALAKTIGKVPVLARVCYGFIGNRMLEGYFREAQMMLLEGASPAQIDTAMENFGMAMGPLAVADLAGLDVGHKARQAIPNLPDHPAVHVADQLVTRNRLGQKTGAGFYRYDARTRARQEDPEVDAMIRAEAARLGIQARAFTDAEIVERAIYPLINEGARILEEGIAQRPGDIDIVYLYGYGFPAYRGGPMFYADHVGAKRVYQRICEFRDTLGRPDDWTPAPLLEKMAGNGGRFAKLG